jgi:hypothetical protein
MRQAVKRKPATTETWNKFDAAVIAGAGKTHMFMVYIP